MRRTLPTAGALSAAVLLAAAGCSGSPEDDAVGAAAQTAPPAEARTALQVPVSLGHVHGLGKDPGSGNLLLATHTGLHRASGGTFTRVGPAVDLMGFAVVGPGHYYASGHPQPGVDLPEPVGLIETRDGGETWTALSRGGESDFHALTAAGDGAVGYDGALRRTDDARTWSEVGTRFEPLALTGAAGDPHVVAGTESSVMVSADAGRTWSAVPGSPAPALVSRADNAVIALTADGGIHLADATGTAWRTEDLVAPGASALVASGSTTELEIIVLAEEGLLVSRAGAPFEPLRAGDPVAD
ncbi:F510_1955 family glycosylhydrolase [Oryzobacter sp. R7]|uniref:F510_1955 family glycosylhydrolase n=1 Tax=Oryzobacter faecalis TaxID=3388656 RepID=UPI00398D336E